MPNTTSTDIHMYHEQQEKQLCLLHTLNNLLQEKAFAKRDLDTLCESLDERQWFNAHRSMFGLGNYDVNILMAALATKDLSVTWFDNRLKFKNVKPENVYGYIFNKPTSGVWGYLTRGRHWFAVLQLQNGLFYNFDSKLSKPTIIDDFETFFDKHIEVGDQIFLVTKPESSENCVTNK
uniref:ubiquitinyl hydrolase 1 n=1 Tax=Panagrellus redivivus TaxID=6233 RepID=A0A7E4WBR4_PANRE